MANLLLATIFTFLTGGISLFSALSIFCVISLVIVLFNPSKLFYKRDKEYKVKKKRIVYASLVGLALLFEVFGINYKSYLNVGERQAYDISLVEKGKTTIVDNKIYISDGQYFIVDVKDKEFNNLKLSFAPDQDASFNITVSYREIGQSAYTSFGTFGMDAKNVDYHLIKLPTGKNIEKIGFSFATKDVHVGQSSKIVVTGLTFNCKPRVTISLIRTGLIIGLVSLILYSPNIFAFFRKKAKIDGIPYLAVGAVGTITLLSAISLLFIRSDLMLTNYPIAKSELGKMSTDIFVQLFDAFRKGKVSLDIEPSAKLLALENPYDPAARRGITYLWDHAFYGGKYYCYYGAFPVIFVSFPIYYLSGCQVVPNALGLELIGMAVLIPAFLLLLLEIVRFVRKDFNPVLFILLAICTFFTSLMLAAATLKDGYYHEMIYHVPDIYGLLCLDLYFVFLIRGYRKSERRPLELGFSGFFLVATLASRPNLVFAVLLGVSLYLGILFRKDRPWKKKLVDFGPAVGIILVGGIILCVYNKARFDSFFEFGQSYQLTVADQRHLTYSLDKFKPSFIHFFLQGVNFNEYFPHITTRYVTFGFDNCPYIRGYTGVLVIPFFVFALLLPFVFWKSSRWDFRLFTIMFPIIMVLFAYTTYSKAGICPRYLIEMYHLMSIAGAMVAVKFLANVEETKNYGMGVILVGAVLLVSAYMCLSLSYDGFDGMNYGDLHGLRLFFKSQFAEFNY